MPRFYAPLAALLALLCVPALAQTPAKPAAKPDAKAETKVQVTGIDCRRLFTEHRAAPDVAYKPGVDVNGKPVVGADLNPAPQIKVPETIAFDIAVDLTKYGVPATSQLFQPNVKLGEVRMDLASGKVLYNGEPLGNPEIEALREACRQQGLAPR
ncbi:MAG: hypothetical protein HY059_12710 [Proteobacteria bacterium]|nr:hypothetical protein [Pseudomonadota bacterium]